MSRLGFQAGILLTNAPFGPPKWLKDCCTGFGPKKKAGMPGSRKIDKDKEEQTGPQQTEIENQNFKPVYAFGAKNLF